MQHLCFNRLTQALTVLKLWKVCIALPIRNCITVISSTSFSTGHVHALSPQKPSQPFQEFWRKSDWKADSEHVNRQIRKTLWWCVPPAHSLVPLASSLSSLLCPGLAHKALHGRTMINSTANTCYNRLTTINLLLADPWLNSWGPIEPAPKRWPRTTGQSSYPHK